MVLSCYNTVPNKDAMKKQIVPPNKAQRKLPNNRERVRRREGGREGGGRERLPCYDTRGNRRVYIPYHCLHYYRHESLQVCDY